LADVFERNVYCLLGLPFDAVDLAGAAGRIRDAAKKRRKCFLSTPNLNFIVASLADREFRDSVIRSDLSIADGMPVVWIARLLGIPIPGRVAGSSLFELLRRGPGEQLSIYFFGGPDGAAETACRALSLENGGLTCVGHKSPGFGSIEEMSSEETIQDINASNADFLVVSLGARKGQAWIQRNLQQVNVPVISHLGAVLNFVAGAVQRAPAWVQNSGLEWLWRIKEDPALSRRYLRDGMAFLALVMTRVLPYAWYLLLRKSAADQLATPGIETIQEKDGFLIRLRGGWTMQNIHPLRACFSNVVRAGRDIDLDMGNVSYVDSAFVGLLVLLQGEQQRRGGRLSFISIANPVRRVIRYCCADFLCAGVSSRSPMKPLLP
jgi:N-acetylglucosaminyldiphosphoundecaprenol N-acetyl-beta-D-mannosaminyltransferase